MTEHTAERTTLLAGRRPLTGAGSRGSRTTPCWTDDCLPCLTVHCIRAVKSTKTRGPSY